MMATMRAKRCYNACKSHQIACRWIQVSSRACVLTCSTRTNSIATASSSASTPARTESAASRFASPIIALYSTVHVHTSIYYSTLCAWILHSVLYECRTLFVRWISDLLIHQKWRNSARVGMFGCDERRGELCHLSRPRRQPEVAARPRRLLRR